MHRKTRFDLAAHEAPQTITKEELHQKLGHLRSVLQRANRSAILLSREGAMRWLTGTRHQITDIAPDANSPVSALVHLDPGAAEITFITTRIEMPRVRDQLPEVFRNVPDVTIDFRESLPPLPDEALIPGHPGYEEVHSEIVSPLVGGFEGHQLRKLEWLYAMTQAVLTETALDLVPGMNGAEVRGELFRNLAEQDIECNLILVALAGQERHFHPLYNSRYHTERGCWVKLVAGTRFAELIASTTAMVKIASSPTKEEARVYAALQRGAVEYADLYRSGSKESEIYAEVGKRFAMIESETGLKGFQPSAYFHHMGGPTSPMGNRDYLLEAGGGHTLHPWIQFAINPCDVLQYTKVELQGIIMPEGPPRMLDGSIFVPSVLGLFSEVRAGERTIARVANVVEAPG
jgi:hypothetical protein